MRITYEKNCPRCGRTHNRKDCHYCDLCERIVLAWMYENRYRENRRTQVKLPQQPKASEVKP